jgi:hypothetical protein
MADVDRILHDLENQATRHQRASDDPDLLIGDLERIEAKVLELRKELERNRPPEPVPARAIPRGGFFRKRRGEMAYLRISDSAVKYLRLDREKVYGVGYNGNVSVMEPDKLVIRTTVEQFLENIGDEQRFNDTFAHGEAPAAMGGD